MARAGGSSAQNDERRRTEVEPPRPPGLDRVARLSGILSAFVEFMRLDADLLAVALNASRAPRRTAEALLEEARSSGAGGRGQQ